MLRSKIRKYTKPNNINFVNEKTIPLKINIK